MTQKKNYAQIRGHAHFYRLTKHLNFHKNKVFNAGPTRKHALKCENIFYKIEN